MNLPAMHDIAFLITNQYQIHHFAPIARALPYPPSVVIEIRDQDFGLSEAFINEHLPGTAVEWVHKRDLRRLDGRFDLIVCQTPVLAQVFLSETLVVAQQYSLAKERYQYGVWRSLAHLNLMFGGHSLTQVDGFTNARAVGNPMFDRLFTGRRPEDLPLPEAATGRLRVLYLPTYGSLASVSAVTDHLDRSGAEVTVKLHHMSDDAQRGSLPAEWKVVGPDADPVDLIVSADLVISDYSGAAFDAAYARRPLVLVDGARPSTTDLERLSTADLDRAALRRLSVPFDRDQPLSHLAAAAREKLEEREPYLEFVHRHFVNHGCAAEACASAITELLDTGVPEHFGWSQVRDRNQDLIQRNRALQDENRRLRAANDRLRTGPGRRLAAHAERGARRGRALIARSPRVERRAVELKHRIVNARGGLSTARPTAFETSGADEERSLPYVPSEARQLLAERLASLATRAGLHMPRVDIDGYPLFALKTSVITRLVPVLHQLSDEFPRLRTVTRMGAMPARRSKALDLQAVQHVDLELRSPQWTATVAICFTAVRSATGRTLALDTRSPRVDWTHEFEQTTSSSTSPVRRVSREFDGPIDVVYTWVDSSDQHWRASRQQYSGDDSRPPSADNDERFLDRHELRYSLRSVWTYAPFVRRIYIVTSGQVPAWLDRSDERIELVTHESIFPDSASLPTFNSHATEACLHRIPGLSEHFVYFNDDFFLGREITPGDWFTRAGLPRVRFAPSQFVLDGPPPDNAIPTDWAAYNATRRIEHDLGMSFDRKHQHVPYALTASMLAELERRYPTDFEATRRARFRSATDLAIPSMFAPYFGVASGRAVEWDTPPGDYGYADTGRADADERLTEIIAARPKFFCLNSTLHRVIALPAQARAISQLLEHLFPHPSPYEVRRSHV